MGVGVWVEGLAEASRSFFNHGVNQKPEDLRRVWACGILERKQDSVVADN